jgi:uncharacterized protein YndB with AHSA1/START domain
MDIHHGMAVRAAEPEQLYKALTRQDELAAWMGVPTLARPEVGSLVEFRINQGKSIMQMEVIRLEVDSLVQWRQIQPIWQTSRGISMPDQMITWTLSTPWESGTLVDFRMSEWLEDGEAYSSSSFKWASLMLRLRVYMGDTRDVIDLIPFISGNQSL